MVEEDIERSLARLRIELRTIDDRIAALRRESDYYRRLGFGRDVKDIQMMALQDERAALLGRMAMLQQRNPRRASARARQDYPLVSWLLLPLLLVLMATNAIAPRRRSRRDKFLESRRRLRIQPRMSFDLS